MELLFSSSGIPFIVFDDKKTDVFEIKREVRLAFAGLTKNAKNFKYVTVRGYRSTISAKRKLAVIERENFLADIHLNGFPKGFTSDECHNFTKHKYTFLRKVLRKYIVEHEDGDYIPLASIKKIAKDLEGYKEPKRRLRKKKKVRGKVVHLTDEALAEKKAKKEAAEKKKAEKEKKAKGRELKKREKEIEKLEKEFNGKGKKRRKRKAKPKRLKKAKSTKTVENKLSKTCKACSNELFTVPSCGSKMLEKDGEKWMPIVHRGKEPCKACGVFAGGRHHLYCPHEKCPRCGGKFATCGCF